MVHLRFATVHPAKPGRRCRSDARGSVSALAVFWLSYGKNAVRIEGHAAAPDKHTHCIVAFTVMTERPEPYGPFPMP